MNRLDAEGRAANAEEQRILARYASWGGAAALFDRRKPEWADLRGRLEEAVDQDTYRELEDTVTTAFFTSPEIVRPMWAALQQAGYSGGAVLEPGSGVGNFIGHAPNTADMVGVEIDSISSRISHHLYPQATIINNGFEKNLFQNNVFTAAIGNVPFAQRKLHDPQHNPDDFSIHNHFISKSIDLVKPGGYVAVVTSTATSDSLTSKARLSITERSDLVSALRIPAGAFSENAGTDVTTDLLVFRVREPGQEKTDLTTQWEHTTKWDFPDGEKVSINEVFVNDRRRVLGDIKASTNQFGNIVMGVSLREGDNLEELIAAGLSADIDAARAQGLGLTVTEPQSVNVVTERMLSTSTVIPSTIRYERSGTRGQKLAFFQFNGQTQEWEKIRVSSGANAEEWAALLDIRDVVVSLRDAYNHEDDDPERVVALQEELERQYSDYLLKWPEGINRSTKKPLKSPTQKQQNERFQELVAEWREQHGYDDAEQPPAELVEEFQREAAEPVDLGETEQKHFGRLKQDPRIQDLKGIERRDKQTGQLIRGTFFYENPARKRTEITYVDTVDDGIEVSLDRHGVIDPAYISDLMDTELFIVEEELEASGRAFRDPDNPDIFIRAEEYLSGYVVDKLDVARRRAATDERLARNVEALEGVQPEFQTDVLVRPGVQWLNKKYYKEFIAEVFEVNEDSVKVDLANDVWTVQVGRWEKGCQADIDFGVVVKHIPQRPFNFEYRDSEKLKKLNVGHQGVACTANHGVVIPAYEMFENLLNLKTPTLNWNKEWKEKHPGSPTVHSDATAFAGDQAAKLSDRFSEWLMSDETRRMEVLAEYNKRFNSYVIAKWNGAYRTMPGLGTSFTPYSYQLNAVERMVNEPSVLLNHAVGAGKTGTFLMGAAELKRLGVISQPWFIVPKHLVGSIAEEAQQWYPGAKVLSSEAFDGPEGRREFVAISTAEDWDFVICADSLFKLIPMSAETRAEYILSKVEALDKELKGLTRASGPNSHGSDNDQEWSVKQIVKARQKLQDKLAELVDQKKDTGIEFESTRCDYLVVDEAHNYKNLGRTSIVPDLSAGGADKASDMDMKIQYLHSRARSVHTPVVTFATGTPLSNNVSELWVHSKYLRPDVLEHAGVASVNAWAAQFTKQDSAVEVKPSGVGLHNRVRTRSFINAGDLAVLCGTFMDVVTSEQIEAKRPALKGGKNTVVEFEIGEEARDFIHDFEARSQNKWVNFEENANAIDGPLKILGDGRKVALDPRLVNLDYEGFSPRVQAVTEQVIRIWQENKDNIYLDRDGVESDKPGGLQIIFLDQSTPKGEGEYNVYDQLRKSFAAEGMDPKRVAFIHEWEKNKTELYELCRTGGIDVLISSTSKGGTGVNVQDRAVALHHVDVPWRPADLEQREGRIIRQGNQNPEVEILNYVARGTTDAVSWDTIYRKQALIDQFMRADRSLREIEGLGEESAAEAAAFNKAVATGDPRYMELMKLNKEVATLQRKRDTWVSTRANYKLQIEIENATIKRSQRNAEWAIQHAPQAQEWKARDVKNREWTLNPNHTSRFSFNRSQTFTDRGKAAKEFAQRAREWWQKSIQEPTRILEIGGVEWSMRFNSAFSGLEIYPTDYGTNAPRDLRMLWKVEDLGMMEKDAADLETKETTAKEYGLLERVENKVKFIADNMETVETTYIAGAHKRLEKLGIDNDETEFPQAAELSKITRERDELQEVLASIDDSAEARRRAAEREERMQVRGRVPGWSLQLSPTEAYASLVEEATREQVVWDAKRREADKLRENDQISLEEYQRRITRLGERPADPPADDDKEALRAELEGGAVIDVDGHYFAESALDDQSKALVTEPTSYMDMYPVIDLTPSTPAKAILGRALVERLHEYEGKPASVSALWTVRRDWSNSGLTNERVAEMAQTNLCLAEAVKDAPKDIFRPEKQYAQVMLYMENSILKQYFQEYFAKQGKAGLHDLIELAPDELVNITESFGPWFDRYALDLKEFIQQRPGTDVGTLEGRNIEQFGQRRNEGRDNGNGPTQPPKDQNGPDNRPRRADIGPKHCM